ncbi:unnamed protein product [Bursaphelenchus xylophilus]|uniref:(pine wood nematode) hypothetical protein n=1 Tax=Bursaphelenchus xylophilus TaxID=6326 RepID=A0A1I7S2L1_BURXY|nr:unnamed protein product [Bursaphelenchus xylophilus]CAG9121873.1 unnamed protein product [Bursaphelenchus xylophilus]
MDRRKSGRRTVTARAEKPVKKTIKKARMLPTKMEEPSSSSGSSPTVNGVKKEDWISGFESMDKDSQMEALTMLIQACRPTHLRHLHQIVEPLLQKDIVSLLPKEVSHLILGYLSAEDLYKASMICRRWRFLCEDNLLWREKCSENGVATPIEPPNLSHRSSWELAEDNILNNQNARLNFWEAGRVVPNRENEPDTDNACFRRAYWKAIYLRNNRIYRNWMQNKPTAQCHLAGHDDHVITGMQVKGDLIATSSDDATVRIWSISQAKCVHVLQGHGGGVWSMLLTDDGKKVISGSTDRTARIWSTETGEQLFCLQGHTSTVRCMAMQGNRLVTGSRDCTARLWNLDTGECVNVFVAHYAAIRCVEYDGKHIITGSYDHKIAVFDEATGERTQILVGHQNRVYSLLLDKEKGLLFSGSLDQTIRVWDINDGTCIHTLVGHNSLTSAMQLRNGYLISGNADHSIRVWNIEDGTCVHILSGQNSHTAAVTGLQFIRDDLIVSSSDDGIVKLWNIKSGTFICNLVQLQPLGGCVWRVEATPTCLVCAVGSRNQAEDTKLIIVDFDAPYP